MSRYKIEELVDEDENGHPRYELFLLAIANELAESNRLKRQEIVIAHLGDKPDHFKKIVDMLGDGIHV